MGTMLTGDGFAGPPPTASPAAFGPVPSTSGDSGSTSDASPAAFGPVPSTSGDSASPLTPKTPGDSVDFAHLHVRSWFSFRAGASSPEDLARTAVRHGVSALAITDFNGVYGAIQHQQACEKHGLPHIFGAEVPVEGHHLVLLAQSRNGYAGLCRLLTAAHLRSREEPSATFEELAMWNRDLFCLTGTHEGHLYRLLDAGQIENAVSWTGNLQDIFGDRLFIEMSHNRRRGDDRRLRQLIQLGKVSGVSTVATGDVRYATPDEYRRYDLMTCIRNRITVFDDHEERPANDAAYLQSAAELRTRGLPEDALARTMDIARACSVNLIPGHIIPPGARLPRHISAKRFFRRKIEAGFERKYPPGSPRRAEAETRLRKEVNIIESLDIQEFFLVVHEVIEEAQRSGVRCQGRGSAANSIVTYLLDITPVCPVEHNLLFERFLHRGRKGTPDIDLDFDSSRRLEIVHWMEERFGASHTGMAATIDRYLTKGAVQDTAKALGWPAEMAKTMSKGCGYGPVHDDFNRAHIEKVAGGASPMTDVLIRSASDLYGAPRHLGQHSGGMVLTREPISQFTPLQISANGVRVVQFAKDDLEWLGLVKLDVLGLRMLGAISEAAEITADREGVELDLATIPHDDPSVYDMIGEGDVLGLFQIESPAQMNAGARIQSRSMQDLIKQISLVRPGPIMGGLMHPFIRRHRGLEPVRYDHPMLKEILHDTYGVIIFQEQVLEVVHRFAGLSLDEADAFRRLMSRFRDSNEMEGMRGRFVESAMENGISESIANRVFDQVSKFVGYGFCRSHAAAFALAVYQSAYLKRYHPAAFFAAIMQHRPGMYALMTLEQDARRHGVRVLVPDINRSGIRYDLEPMEIAREDRGTPNTTWAVRKPLPSVKGVSEELAKTIVLERASGPYRGIEDLYHRVPIADDELTALAKAGAFDQLEGANRTALFKLRVLMEQIAKRQTQLFARGSGQGSLIDTQSIRDEDVPALPGISLRQRLEWDLSTHSGPRAHPMVVIRETLATHEVRTMSVARRLGDMPGYDDRTPPLVTVAGLVMFRQRPGTAKGTMFVFLEDETGFIQCICRPDVRDRFDEELRQSAIVVRGRLQVAGPWRGVMVQSVWPISGMIGGYRGTHGGPTYGRDAREMAFSEKNAETKKSQTVAKRDAATR